MEINFIKKKGQQLNNEGSFIALDPKLTWDQPIGTALSGIMEGFLIIRKFSAFKSVMDAWLHAIVYI